MKPFATGLVVGKFAPLHCGHEKLINTALAQCEELFIISYSVPEMPDCEPEKRLTWLQVRFPQATFLVLTPELVARYNLPAIPHNNADADIHRHYVRRYACRYYVAAHTLYLLQKTMAMALLTCWRGVLPNPLNTFEWRAQLAMKRLRERLFVPMFTAIATCWRMMFITVSFAVSVCLVANLPVKARFQKRWRACLIRCMSLNLAATIGKKKRYLNCG